LAPTLTAAIQFAFSGLVSARQSLRTLILVHAGKVAQLTTEIKAAAADKVDSQRILQSERRGEGECPASTVQPMLEGLYINTTDSAHIH
jgi:hypothetical protein